MFYLFPALFFLAFQQHSINTFSHAQQTLVALFQPIKNSLQIFASIAIIIIAYYNSLQYLLVFTLYLSFVITICLWRVQLSIQRFLLSSTNHHFQIFSSVSETDHSLSSNVKSLCIGFLNFLWSSIYYLQLIMYSLSCIQFIMYSLFFFSCLVRSFP